MRELDEAGFELQLRRALTDHLGSLHLELTVADLELRLERRIRDRGRRRVWLMLGLAAALVVPVGWLAAGAPIPHPNRAVVTDVAPSETPTTRPTIAPTATPSDLAPAGSRELLVVTGPRAASDEVRCDDVDAYGSDGGGARRLVTCADHVAISPDGSTAAIGGDKVLVVYDLRQDRQVGAITTSGRAVPIEWSPSGRRLWWTDCVAAGSNACSRVIGSPRTDKAISLPTLASIEGGRFGTRWLPDESHLLTSDWQGGWLVGDADGSNLQPLNSDSILWRWMNAESGVGYDRPAALSPDGQRLAYRATGPKSTRAAPVNDLWLSSTGAELRDLTNFEAGATLRAVAWSPDGQSIAVVKGSNLNNDGALSETWQAGPNELWVIGLDGSMRRLEAPGGLYACNCVEQVPIHWSPDGTRLAIEVATDVSGTSIDTIVIALDGSQPVLLKDAQRAQWSRDGQSVAVLGTTGPSDRAENDAVSPVSVDVVNADGSDRHVVVDLPAGADTPGFTWAAR
jgi:dipeptidyl aminopeptidase/acylaminoacyl peptidase